MFLITNLPIASLLFATGILLLYFGGEGLVKGSAQTAFRLGVKPLFIGLTVVAYGTSLPEFGVSFTATLSNHGEIAVGNVIGSTICNVLLVLGVAAIIKPLKIEKEIVKKEAPIAVIAILIVILFSFKFVLNRFVGAILLICFTAYLLFIIWHAKKSKLDNYRIKAKPMWQNIIFLLAGFAGVALGARLLVNSSVFIAYTIGIPEAVIALTLVAIGTSLPELAISSIASFRGHADISAGTLIGSNIFNVLLVLGACALVAPLLVTTKLFFNILIALLVCAIIIPMLYTGYKLSRIEGVILLMGYALYIGYLYCS